MTRIDEIRAYWGNDPSLAAFIHKNPDMGKAVQDIVFLLKEIDVLAKAGFDIFLEAIRKSVSFWQVVDANKVLEQLHKSHPELVIEAREAVVRETLDPKTPKEKP